MKKKVKVLKKKKESRIDFYRLIVCVSLPEALKNKTVIWGKEIKLAKKLADLYPDRDFWESFKPERESRFTLTFYLTDMGLKELKEHEIKMNLFVEEDVEKIIISEKKLGENKIIEEKEKSIFEFLS